MMQRQAILDQNTTLTQERAALKLRVRQITSTIAVNSASLRAIDMGATLTHIAGLATVAHSSQGYAVPTSPFGTTGTAAPQHRTISPSDPDYAAIMARALKEARADNAGYGQANLDAHTNSMAAPADEHTDDFADMDDYKEYMARKAAQDKL